MSNKNAGSHHRKADYLFRLETNKNLISNIICGLHLLCRLSELRLLIASFFLQSTTLAETAMIQIAEITAKALWTHKNP